jgi:hypothetical protein
MDYIIEDSQLEIDNQNQVSLPLGTTEIQHFIKKQAYEAASDNFQFENTNIESDNFAESNLFELLIEGRITKSTEISTYFRNLYKIRQENALIKYASQSAYTILIDKALDFYNKVKSEANITQGQLSLFLQSIEMISEHENLVNIPQIHFNYIKEEFEIIIIKPSESGNSYIIIGDEENDVSYGFVGNTPGEYESLHADFLEIGLEQILDKFNN